MKNCINEILNCIDEILYGAQKIFAPLLILLALGWVILLYLNFVTYAFSDLQMIYTKNLPLLFFYTLVISLATATILHLMGLLIRTINLKKEKGDNQPINLEKEKVEEMKKYKGTVYGNVIIGAEIEFDGLTEEEILFQMKDRLREIGVDVLMDYTNSNTSSEDLEMVYLEKEECK